MVVEPVVGLAGEELEAYVLVALDVVEHYVHGVGGVRVEVARGYVALLEHGLHFVPFFGIVAYRHAHLCGRAVPCVVVALLEVECHGIGPAGRVGALEAQVVRCVFSLCVPSGVPVRAVGAVYHVFEVLAFFFGAVVAVNLRHVGDELLAVGVGGVLVVEALGRCERAFKLVVERSLCVCGLYCGIFLVGHGLEHPCRAAVNVMARPVFEC